MKKAEEVAAIIAELVGQSPDKTLLGVRLGIKLRNSVSDFSPLDYGCRNLRQFIAKFAPQIRESGRSGADITYTVTDVTKSVADTVAEFSKHQKLPVDLHCWKAFTNPSYPFLLITNRTTGEFKAIALSEPPPPAPWVVIPKCTSEVHLKIARSFTETLAEPHRASMNRVLDDPKWFVRFYGILQHIGLGSSWGAYKREGLIQEFHLILNQLDIKATAIDTGPAINTEKPLHHARPSRVAKSDEETEFRKLVGRLVNALSVSELRALRVPLGDVFDAMTKDN